MGCPAALADTQARRIVFLGDFLHSRRSHATGTLAALSRWRARHRDIELTLVRGNHDERAGDPPARPGHHGGGRTAGARAVRALPSSAGPSPDAYVLAGHWHPCISVSGRAFERLRLPCFWFGDDSGALPGNAVGVLPAFGSFTGMHRIEPRAGDRIFPIAGEVVRAIPALPIA